MCDHDSTHTSASILKKCPYTKLVCFIQEKAHGKRNVTRKNQSRLRAVRRLGAKNCPDTDGEWEESRHQPVHSPPFCERAPDRLETSLGVPTGEPLDQVLSVFWQVCQETGRQDCVASFCRMGASSFVPRGSQKDPTVPAVTRVSREHVGASASTKRLARAKHTALKTGGVLFYI